MFDFHCSGFRRIASQQARIGIIGAGAVVETLHLPVLAAMPSASLSWICDLALDRAREVARRFGIAAAYSKVDECPDVDVVLVAIPIGVRRPVLEQCFARRFNVFSEKPFARTVEEHDTLIQGAERAGVRIGVALMRRFYQSTRTAARIVRDRSLGTLKYVLAGEGGRMRGTGRGADWYQTSREAAGGGVLIETGSHLVDQVALITGASDLQVDEYEHTSCDGVEGHARVRASCSIPHASNFPVEFQLSRIDEVPNGIWLKFDEALVKLDCASTSAVTILDRRCRPIGIVSPEPGASLPLQAFYAEWRSFLAECAGGPAGDTSARKARLSTALIQQCYARARAGRAPASTEAS
jgi:predicted dehydrogenase